mgnify:FL=1
MIIIVGAENFSLYLFMGIVTAWCIVANFIATDVMKGDKAFLVPVSLVCLLVWPLILGGIVISEIVRASGGEIDLP